MTSGSHMQMLQCVSDIVNDDKKFMRYVDSYKREYLQFALAFGMSSISGVMNG